MSQNRLAVEHFFDEVTSTFTYLVYDRLLKAGAVVDPVLNYDPKSGRTSSAGVDSLLHRIDELKVHVDWVLETHVHADHLTAAPLIKRATGAKIAIGSRITDVQQIFGNIFNVGPEFVRDGRQFDRLLLDGEEFQIGGLSVVALHTPGHTPACMTYLVRARLAGDMEDSAFVGDTIFMHDYGTARCDFPGGSAKTLFASIKKLLSLDPATRLYLCHDYRPGGRQVECMTTVEKERSTNIHVHDGIAADAFVAMREARDATLSAPQLIIPSVQVNMRAGQFPPEEANGTIYLKVPINRL